MRRVARRTSRVAALSMQASERLRFVARATRGRRNGAGWRMAGSAAVGAVASGATCCESLMRIPFMLSLVTRRAIFDGGSRILAVRVVAIRAG